MITYKDEYSTILEQHVVPNALDNYALIILLEVDNNR